MPDNLKKYIKSWSKFCPDYKIIKWDETNYDFCKNKYMKEAYINKKWGFVPDYARLDIIYNYGGIYLDTDVELLKNLDSLLHCHGFVACEDRSTIALGLGFGAEAGNGIIKEMLKEYDERVFCNDDGSLNMKSSPQYQTAFFEKRGFVSTNEITTVDGITIYPSEYFNPTDLKTGKVTISKNTFSIHHYQGSWLPKRKKVRYSVHKLLNRVLGEKITNSIRNVVLKIKL